MTVAELNAALAKVANGRTKTERKAAAVDIETRIESEGIAADPTPEPAAEPTVKDRLRKGVNDRMIELASRGETKHGKPKFQGKDADGTIVRVVIRKDEKLPAFELGDRAALATNADKARHRLNIPGLAYVELTSTKYADRETVKVKVIKRDGVYYAEVA